MEAEKVKTYLNEGKWNQIKSECPQLLSTVQQLHDVWTKEPLLQTMQFSREHFEGLLNEKSNYIARVIKQHVAATMEKLSPGMGALVAEPNLTFDRGRVDRCVDNIASNQFRTYVHQHNISFDKQGNPFISDATLKELKESSMVELTTTNDGILSRAMKIEALSEELFELVKAKKMEQQRKSKIAYAGNVQLISKRGEGINTPLVIENGTLKFNPSFM